MQDMACFSIQPVAHTDTTISQLTHSLIHIHSHKHACTHTHIHTYYYTPPGHTDIMLRHLTLVANCERANCDKRNLPY